MITRAALSSLLACLLITGFNDAFAAAKQYQLTQDAQAVSAAQTAIAAMGGVEALLGYQDSLSTGSAVIYKSGTPVSYPITMKSKGLRETRVELRKSNGTNIRIMNGGQAAVIRPDGTVKALYSNNTFYEHVNHIPLFSILGAYPTENVNLLYKGQAQVQGQSENVIEIDFTPNLDPVQAPIYVSMSRTLFFVNQVTGLVDKIQDSPFNEGDNKNTFTEEIYFSDYRTINNALVPFHQVLFIDGAIDTDITFTSVTFNVGLSDSDFAIPQAR